MPEPLQPPEIETALKRVQRASAPAGLWQDVVTGLNRAPKPNRPVVPRPMRAAFAAAAIIAAAIGGAYLGVYRLYRNPTRWTVVRLDGTPMLEGTPLGDGGSLQAGQWLITDSVSRARVGVGRIGTAVVGPDSRIRMDDGGIFSHNVTLDRGSLDAIITAPPRLFFVRTPSTLATDLGCAYTLRVDSLGNTRIHVTIGWVELDGNGRSGGRVSMVPAGLVAEVETGSGPGTPYPIWLSEDASTALRRIDRGTGTAADVDRVLTALETTSPVEVVRQERAITLWHLVQRVDDDLRPRVFEHLTRLSPPPAGVTREGILALQRPMLERWRRDLNPLWSEEAQPPIVRVTRALWDWIMR
jgi:hypothetical protein